VSEGLSAAAVGKEIAEHHRGLRTTHVTA